MLKEHSGLSKNRDHVEVSGLARVRNGSTFDILVDILNYIHVRGTA